MLDHASVSRQHAILCYQTDSNKWVVVDQGSAHGTSVNGKSTVKVKLLLEVAHNTILSRDNCPAVVNESCDTMHTAAQMLCMGVYYQLEASSLDGMIARKVCLRFAGSPSTSCPRGQSAFWGLHQTICPAESEQQARAPEEKRR